MPSTDWTPQTINPTAYTKQTIPPTNWNFINPNPPTALLGLSIPDGALGLSLTDGGLGVQE